MVCTPHSGDALDILVNGTYDIFASNTLGVIKQYACFLISASEYPWLPDLHKRSDLPRSDPFLTESEAD